MKHIITALIITVTLSLLGQQCPAANSPQSSTVSAPIPGISKLITVTIPADFRAPSSPEEIKASNTLIQALQNNPLGKSVVSQVYSTDWSAPLTLPILYVGTLPAAVKSQGQYTEKYWANIREMFMKQSKLMIVTINSQLVTYGLPDASVSMNRILADANKNTAIIFGFAPTAQPTEKPPMLVARKVFFAQNCIFLFEIAVDASKPLAMDTLDGYLRSITVP